MQTTKKCRITGKKTDQVMDADKWTTSRNPTQMLEWLVTDVWDHVSDRKKRLIACATVRGYFVGNTPDGPGNWTTSLGRLLRDAEAMADTTMVNIPEVTDVGTYWLLYADANSVLRRLVQKLRNDDGGWGVIYWSKATDIIREVAGNPFRVVPFQDRWKTPDVRNLAAAAYQNRRESISSEYLALLADACEDAGCDDNALLAHLRGEAGQERCRCPYDKLPRHDQSRRTEEQFHDTLSTNFHPAGCWALDEVRGVR